MHNQRGDRFWGKIPEGMSIKRIRRGYESLSLDAHFYARHLEQRAAIAEDRADALSDAFAEIEKIEDPTPAQEARGNRLDVLSARAWDAHGRLMHRLELVCKLESLHEEERAIVSERQWELGRNRRQRAAARACAGVRA